MKQLKFALFIFFLASLVACSGGESKKVVVMSSGKMTVDQAKKSITLEPGTQHNEEVISFNGDDKATVTVQGPDGEQAFELSDNGLYVLNLKQNDTLVGGLVNYSANTKRERITDKELTRIIDSTRRLILGQGASDETKTYYILPFTVKKISTNLDSRVVGPYESIPYKLEGKDGKLPEVYKLYTNKQQRESLLDLFRRMK